MLGYAAAGSAAWGVASLAESPIDFYKSQMQKQLIAARIVRAPQPHRLHSRAQLRSHACCGKHANALGADACTRRVQDPNCKPKFSGMADCVRQSIAANGPLRGPLQGFSATLLRNLPAAAVYFGTFEALKARRPARFVR